MSAPCISTRCTIKGIHKNSTRRFSGGSSKRSDSETGALVLKDYIARLMKEAAETGND
jgi:hypothetical protein